MRSLIESSWFVEAAELMIKDSVGESGPLNSEVVALQLTHLPYQCSEQVSEFTMIYARED